MLSGQEPQDVCGVPEPAEVGHARDRGRAQPRREQAGEKEVYEKRMVEHRCGRGRGSAAVGCASEGTTISPGGLPACQASLRTCQADLTACEGELATCVTFPGDGVDGPALSYTDNRDGTATDNNTLLMWEQKDNNGGVHDMDNAYTWSNNADLPNGTLFTVFLHATLQ